MAGCAVQKSGNNTGKSTAEEVLYTQALKEYFGGKCNPRKIIKYARQFNLEPKVRTYMEVLG